ncbi:unnamed protein product, partial [Closterium sp. NIES-53]
FDTWLDDLQLYLLSDSRDSVSLFDHTSGAATAPPATADSATCSQWLTRDAATCLAIRNHLPLAECAHFGQHRTAQALYDAVVARYSSPATTALSRLLLPYLFPELSAFATVEDLVSHLRTSDARYRAARGTPRTPFFEGCSPSPLAPSYASAALVDVLGAEEIRATSASAKHRRSKGKGGRGGGDGSGSGGGGSSGGSGGNGGGGSHESGGGSGGVGGGGGGTGGSGGRSSGGGGGGRTRAQRGGSGGGERQRQQRRSETPSLQQLCEWLFQRGVSGSSVSCSYVIHTGDRAGQICGKPHTQHRCFSCLNDARRAEFGDEVERPHWAELLSAEGDCCQCVPPDPGIEAAALGASESSLPGTTPAEALQTFTLDSGASRFFFRDSTTLTPLPALVPVRLADPSEGPVIARSSTVLPFPATPSGSLSGLHLPLFSTNLGRVCTHWLPSLLRQLRLPKFLRQVRSLPPLPPLPASPSLPCVEGRQRAAPHSSSFPPTTAPLQTLHMDVWGPARISGQGRERYFLLVVDDYTQYTTVFPLCSKGQVVDVLILWIRAVRLQLRERFRADLLFLRLHSDRGGEFSSDLLREFCRREGILQWFTLPDSPQQNGIAEWCIGLVMEVARTSMIHAAAPHFLWPFAVWYAAHQLNLWPRWQFYHPTSRRVFLSQDVTFDESVPFYHHFPYRSAPPSPPPLFLALGSPPVDPLPPQGTYFDALPPSRANIVDGMWIFRVKRPPGSPPAFKARYVARVFSQRQGVENFRTFSLIPKMTTLRVLRNVAAQRDYELHSLDFSTAFLQGSLHEEIWLRRPPGFTGSFPAGTQWSLRRPVYGLRQAPCEWHETLRSTLTALGFAPSTADPSMFLRTDTSVPPFYVLVYVLQRFGFQFSSPQPTPLSTSHSLSAPPSKESVELSGP